MNCILIEKEWNKMKRIKSLLFVALLMAITLTTTGCVDANFHVTINKDGSGDVNYKMLFEPMLIGLGSQGGTDMVKEMEDGATKQGFTVSKLNENNKAGFEAKKHVANLSEEMKKGNMFGNENMDKTFKPGEGLSIQKTFFKTTYKLSSDLDMSSMAGKPTDDQQTKAMATAMLRSMKFDFALTLPVKATNQNAAKTEDDGKTLVWNLTPGEHNQINVTAEAWNITNIVLVGAGAAVVIILVIVVLVRKRSQNNFYV
jgi:hypothetical protein